MNILNLDLNENKIKFPMYSTKTIKKERVINETFNYGLHLI